MNVPKWISPLFYLAALYDGVLGAVFLAMPTVPFEQLDVAPPNHIGYVQFPAALLLIFGLIFLRIARDPIANRCLIQYGILLKVSYCAVSGIHWLSAGIPWMWKPFTIADFAMLALFIWAYIALGQCRAAEAA